MQHNQTINAPRSLAETASLVADFDDALGAHRTQLLDDLAIYRGKLRDLERLDPLDFTGLQHLYTAHVSEIEKLLADLSAADQTASV